jgi:hypothetical protein
MPCSSSSLALLPNGSAFTLSGISTSAVTMLLVAPLPNQRLDLDFVGNAHPQQHTARSDCEECHASRRVRHSQYSTKDSRSRSSSTSPSS